MGKNGRMVGSDFTFSFFLPCAAFNISHLSLNYSLFKGERTQKISPHFDPITDNNNKVTVYCFKPRFLME